MYEQATFADNLKKIISQRGTTQRRIAEELGVTETTISRYVTTGPKGRTPNVKILVSAYEKAALEQREAIWSMMNAFMLLTPEQKVIIEAINNQEKTEAV